MLRKFFKVYCAFIPFSSTKNYMESICSTRKTYSMTSLSLSKKHHQLLRLIEKTHHLMRLVKKTHHFLRLIENNHHLLRLIENNRHLLRPIKKHLRIINKCPNFLNREGLQYYVRLTYK